MLHLLLECKSLFLKVKFNKTSVKCDPDLILK